MADTPTIQADQIADAIVAVPGQTITLFADQVASTQTIVSATFADFPSSSLPEQTFTVAVAGTYDVAVLLSCLSPANINEQGIAHFQAIVDEGDYNGFTEQIIGSQAGADKEWQLIVANGGNSEYDYKTVYASLDLEIGTHKIKFQVKQEGGAPRVSTDASFKAVGFLRSGSGAGGVLGTSDEYTAGSYTGGSGVQEIMSKSVTVAQGDLLQASASFTFNPSTSATCSFSLKIDGTIVDGGNFGFTGGGGSHRRFVKLTGHKADLAGGSVAVSVEVDSGATLTFDNTERIQTQIYRGGQVPVQQAGTSIVDTPRAFNFLGAAVENNNGVADIHLGSTAPGATVTVLDTTATGTVDYGTGSWAEIGAGLLGTFEVAFAGWYNLTINSGVVGASGGGDGYVGLLIDKSGYGGFTEQQAESPFHNVPYNTSRSANTLYLGRYYLEAGTHEARAIWKWSGASALRVDTAAHLQAWATLSSGSGAGGVLTEQKQGNTALSDNSYSSASWVDVLDGSGGDPMTVSVTTVAGDDVLLVVEGYAWNSSGADNWADFRILKNGTDTVHAFRHHYSYSSEDASFDFTALDKSVVAGTHTYALQVYVNTGLTVTVKTAISTKPLKVSSLIYRGGQVPVQQNGTTITSTPAAFDFIGDSVNVTNVGGKAQIDFNGVADGVSIASADASTNPVNVSSSTYVDVAGLSTQITVHAGEIVQFVVEGEGYNGTTDWNAFMQWVDGSDTPLIPHTYGFSRNGGVSATIPLNWTAFYTFATAGTYTVKLQAKTNIGAFDFYDGKIYVVQYQGGYVKPENTPVLEYSSASVVNVAASPGASSTLRMILSDGVRYTATSPLSVDLTASGLGGLDTGSEASSTWYYIYAVPSATAGVFDVVASVTDPDAGGPTGYDIWRYLGAIVNDSSSDIREFIQRGSRIWCKGPTEVNNTTNDADYVAWDTTEAPITASAYFVWYRMQLNSTGEWELRLRPDGFTANDSSDHLYGSAYQSKTGEVYLPRGDTARRIYYRKFAYSGTLNFCWLRIAGWIDGHLAGGTEARAQAVGFSTPENIPVIEYSSASVVNAVAAPGAASELRVLLSDGIRYTATSPLTVDLTASGLGGLDTGAEASSTWYCIYAVPSATAGVFDVVASVTKPAGGGPTGYDIWRYLGIIYNNASSNIRQFAYLNNWHRFALQETDPLLLDTASPAKNTWTALTTTGVLPAGMYDAAEVYGMTMLTSGSSDYYALLVDEESPGWTPTDTSEVLTKSLVLTQPSGGSAAATRGTQTVLTTNGLAYYFLERGAPDNPADLGIRCNGFRDKYLSGNAEARAQAEHTTDYEAISDAEDRPPTDPSVYNDEFSDDSLDASWSWAAAGEPTGGGHSWSEANGRLTMECTNDGGGGTPFTTAAHLLIKTVAFTQSVNLITKADLLTWQDYGHAGIIMADGDALNNAFIVSFQHSSYARIDVSRINGGVGQWNVFAQPMRFSMPLLCINWDYGTSQLNAKVGFDKDNLTTLYNYTPGWTPVRIGFFTRHTSAVSTNSTVGKFEWIRVYNA